MNSVNEIGNLVQDPEIRYTPDGTPVANFTIAVNEKFGENEKVHFLPVVCWRKLAEAVAEYQKKGQRVAVSGRLEQQRWEDKDGNKRSMIKIVAHTVDFLSPKKNGGGMPAEEEPSSLTNEVFPTNDAPEDDIPF